MTAARPSATRDEVIRTPDQRLRVFISSTLGELSPERAAARRAVEQLRLAPVMFELGARPHPPRALYRAYLEQADIFVGIYWQRYGWVAPDMEVSGLEDEFRLGTGLPRLLYVKRPAPDMEPRLRAMLRTLQEEDDAPSYRPFADGEELRRLLVDDIAVLLAERFARVGPASGDAPLAGLSSPPPAPTTRLIGRDLDVAHVAELLSERGRRLVTLTGAGGIGKTRLALAVLERTRPRWPGGAGFVDLSSVTDDGQVLAALAVALGIPQEGREQPLDALARRIGDVQVLLVVDNVEQVVGAAPQLAHLLARCPRLHLLVTSRVVLRVRGEQEWPVRPLELPDGATDHRALDRCSAVELFVDRARGAHPGFELTAGNAGPVVALCQRLDGLPLALELAAARLRTLTPAQVLARLDERLELPAGLADLPERQRTLSATIDWSRSLLDSQAQRLFARLSTFSGVFTLEAAEAVCGWGDVDVVESLSTLVDHSLVSAAERLDGEPGFRMLETVRAHAAHGLGGPTEHDECRERLSRHLLDLFTGAASRSQGPEQALVLRRLDAEVGDIVACLEWAAARGTLLGPLLRGIAGVWVWLQVRNPLRGMLDLEQVVAASPAAASMSAEDWSAFHWLHAGALLGAGRFADVVACLDAHLPELLAHEPPERSALMLTVHAISRPYSPTSPARGELERAMSMLRRAGASANLGYTMAHYGEAVLLDEDPVAARRVHRDALAIAEATGDVNLHAEVQYNLAVDELHAGNREPARDHLARATDSYRSLDHRDGLARCLAVWAALALAEGDARRAARTLGTVAAVRDAIELPAWPLAAEIERRVTDRVRAALGREQFDSDVRMGRRDPVDTVIDALRHRTDAFFRSLPEVHDDRRRSTSRVDAGFRGGRPDGGRPPG